MQKLTKQICNTEHICMYYIDICSSLALIYVYTCIFRFQPRYSVPWTCLFLACMRSDGQMWPRLWRLTFFLRCGSQGIDSQYLKNAEVVRRRSRKLNWQQTLGISVKKNTMFGNTLYVLNSFGLVLTMINNAFA